MSEQSKEPTTKLVAPEGSTTKMVKIRALRDIRLANGKMVTAGNTIEVNEEEAAEFCDIKFPGSYKAGGSIPTDLAEETRAVIYRAQRV